MTILSLNLVKMLTNLAIIKLYHQILQNVKFTIKLTI